MPETIDRIRAAYPNLVVEQDGAWLQIASDEPFPFRLRYLGVPINIDAEIAREVRWQDRMRANG